MSEGGGKSPFLAPGVDYKPLAKPPAKPPATKELPWKCARRHCIEADDVLEWGGGIVGRIMGSGGVG